jgi:DNA mismatch repair protein MutL
LRERFFQLFGERADLIEVRKEAGGLTIHGYVAALGDQGPVRGPQNVFVNRRIVKDRTIAHAISEAYSVATIKERSPEVHLFIEMPLDALDVNVHPTKAEVRFREQSLMHQVIRRAVGDALGQGPAPTLSLSPTALPSAYPAGETLPIPGVLAGGLYPSRWRPTSAEASVGEPDQAPGYGLQASGTQHVAPASAEASAGRPGTQHPAPGTAPASAEASAGRPSSEHSALGTSLIPLGQFRDTFIIAVDHEGVAIIDQHVAHERVLYERTLEKLTGGRLESQRLLTPILVDLPAAGREALVSRAADLQRLGFEVEEFGGEAVKVSALPALLGVDAAAATLRTLAEDLEGFDRGSPAEAALKLMAATIACHAAVKANYPLTYEKMAHILAELAATAYSTICPHGRPVMLRLTRREIEKNFQRI